MPVSSAMHASSLTLRVLSGAHFPQPPRLVDLRRHRFLHQHIYDSVRPSLSGPLPPRHPLVQQRRAHLEVRRMRRRHHRAIQYGPDGGIGQQLGHRGEVSAIVLGGELGQRQEGRRGQRREGGGGRVDDGGDLDVGVGREVGQVPSCSDVVTVESDVSILVCKAINTSSWPLQKKEHKM